MNILVVGDIMVDEYVHVTSGRKAMESDRPVWDEKMIEYRLGGAANVANNIRALSDDCHVSLAGIIGSEYEYGFEHIASLGIEPLVVSVGPTMFKRRYVSDDDGKPVHLLRHDNMPKYQSWNQQLLKAQLPYMLRGRRFDAVIFSDYDKGTIDEELVDICRQSDIIIVDSKRPDLRLFKDSTVVKLNESEYSTQVSQKFYESVESLFKFVVITKGAKGAQLRVFSDDFHRKSHGKWMPAWNRTVTSKVYSIHTIDFPVDKANVVDVTGCGDTHVAAMAVSLVHGNDINHAIRYANAAARDVVQRFGTSVPEGQR